MVEAAGWVANRPQRLGSYRVLVVVNGGWAVGLIDFTVGAMLLRRRMPHPNSVGGSAI